MPGNYATINITVSERLERLNMQQIPELLESLLQQQYRHAQTERILEGYSRQRPVTLRVNTLKADTAAVQAELRNAGIA